MTAELILLRNGTLVDGSGRPPVHGHVLIRGSRIESVGQFEPPAEAQVVECDGLTISPGFIDAHSHSDLQVLEDRREKADQGVTTEVVGNCGFSPYPCGAERGPLRDFANGIFCGGEDWGWVNAREYLSEVARRARLIQVLSLIGHGSLRIAVAGQRQGPLSPGEMDAMEQILADALSEGACGFSTGLMYAPGSSAPFDELLRLCRLVERHGKVYTTHMRSYAWQLLESTEEQIELARRSGCRLQISHLQAVGRANWEKQERALEKIEKARSEGIDVAFDIYPYVAGSTVMTQLLPQWTLDGGVSSLLPLLASPMKRREIATQVREQTAQRWVDILVTSVVTEANRGLVGKNLEEIAASRNSDPVDTMFDILTEERGAVNIVSFNQSEDNLRRLLTHPQCLVISDGFYVKGKPHPRLYGTFPTLLGEVCRERHWLSLPEAVHKITAMPAERFHMNDRGLLAPGYRADIAVFDAEKISSRANYQDPECAPEGVRMVFLEGRLITKN